MLILEDIMECVGIMNLVKIIWEENGKNKEFLWKQ
jgi:hypothetical protein